MPDYFKDIFKSKPKTKQSGRKNQRSKKKGKNIKPNPKKRLNIMPTNRRRLSRARTKAESIRTRVKASPFAIRSGQVARNGAVLSLVRRFTPNMFGIYQQPADTVISGFALNQMGRGGKEMINVGITQAFSNAVDSLILPAISGRVSPVVGTAPVQRVLNPEALQ